jgi:carbon monoxide dehydrogenase subunit G
MKVAGEQILPLDQQATWDLLLNTQVLGRAMPGCESLAPIGPDEYEMRTKIAISSIQGLFSGKIRIEDKHPPVSYRLIVEGQGKIGHVRGSGLLTLAPEGNGTRVSYSGDVQIGGLVAGVGERMLDVTAKMMTKKFFNTLLREAGSATEPEKAPV